MLFVFILFGQAAVGNANEFTARMAKILITPPITYNVAMQQSKDITIPDTVYNAMIQIGLQGSANIEVSKLTYIKIIGNTQCKITITGPALVDIDSGLQTTLSLIIKNDVVPLIVATLGNQATVNYISKGSNTDKLTSYVGKITYGSQYSEKYTDLVMIQTSSAQYISGYEVPYSEIIGLIPNFATEATPYEFTFPGTSSIVIIVVVVVVVIIVAIILLFLLTLFCPCFACFSCILCCCKPRYATNNDSQAPSV